MRHLEHLPELVMNEPDPLLSNTFVEKMADPILAGFAESSCEGRDAKPAIDMAYDLRDIVEGCLRGYRLQTSSPLIDALYEELFGGTS